MRPSSLQLIYFELDDAGMLMIHASQGAMTRAWCMFEMVKTLSKGCKLHVVLSPYDTQEISTILTQKFEQIAEAFAALDACNAQI